MIALLHHDSLVDHLTSAAGLFVVALIVAIFLGIFVYVRQ